MDSASNEMQSYLVIELPSYLRKHFENMGISKPMRDFNVLLDCGEILNQSV